MARFYTTASVSAPRAALILSACLLLGMLIGLLPHNGSGHVHNLRSHESAGQQQEKPAGGSGIAMPKLPDRSLSAAHMEGENRVPAEADKFVWNGDFAAIQEQALDTIDLDLSFSFEFSFEFEGSFSYDYYF